MPGRVLTRSREAAAAPVAASVSEWRFEGGETSWFVVPPPGGDGRKNDLGLALVCPSVQKLGQVGTAFVSSPQSILQETIRGRAEPQPNPSARPRLDSCSNAWMASFRVIDRAPNRQAGDGRKKAHKAQRSDDAYQSLLTRSREGREEQFHERRVAPPIASIIRPGVFIRELRAIRGPPAWQSVEGVILAPFRASPDPNLGQDSPETNRDGQERSEGIRPVTVTRR